VKKYKLWLVVAINMIVFLSCPALAANEEQLSLTKAVDLALQKDFELKISRVDLENEKITYQQNKTDNILAKSQTKKIQNKLMLQQAENEYRQRENEVVIKVVDQYLKLEQKELNLRVKQNKLKLRKKELANIKSQVKKGNKKQVKLMAKRTEYNSAQYNLKEAQDEYDLLLQQFKFNLGLTKQQKISFQAITFPNIWKIKSRQAVEIAKRNSPILALKDEQIQLAKVRLQRNEAADTPQLNIKKLKNKKQLAKLKYQKSLNQLITSVKKSYQKLKQAEAGLKLRQQQLAQVKKEYEIIEEYQKKGLRSKNELLKAKIDYLQIKYNYQKSITNYYLAALQLQKKIGMQVEVNFNELPTKE